MALRRRAGSTRAEAKALRKAAKAEAKAAEQAAEQAAMLEKARVKALKKTTDAEVKTAKALAAAEKKTEKAAKKTGRRVGSAQDTAVNAIATATSTAPAKVGRAIAVGKVVAPLLAPYALAAAGAARAQWDEYRARKLGVPADRLGAYTGRGGALHARISRIAEALPELKSDGDAQTTGPGRRFAADTEPRLADLSVAVRAAEQMPTARRRTAFRAVACELDRIEDELLTQLGVRV
ncbi:DUF6474 family protein [Pseudonocardia benzenivorans]|jgi:hypothetical protein|uniref:Uncharacterized protein n=2 Tax=Pseudonocardia TaxID=1847 RepID=F4CIM0_PSEUX|nr:DUF6474 family protein [Pseudonocardia dioxanivorans]AEA22417.1 hypothetical protein Psed_0141 [Pseudonocardia dioxanivorans CB1190]GJF02204.1 hypothetical protein PSD17_11680 [Pseudonocardia sp. D17]